MLTIARFILGLMLVGILAGCDREYTIDIPPVAAGHISVQGEDGRWRQVALTQDQLREVSHWLGARRAGWRTLMETPPPGTFSIALESGDGRKYSIEMFVRKTGGGTAYASGYDPKPASPLKHSVSDEDIQELRAAAGAAKP